MCIECEVKQIHQDDMDFTVEKIIDLGQMNKIIEENQQKIKSLNIMFHKELVEITNLFLKIYNEVKQAYKNLLKLFSQKDKCYENDFSNLLKEQNSLIEFVHDKQLIKLLTEAPLDIFLDKQQSVLQCFEKVCSNFDEFNQIFHRTKKLEEEFQKIIREWSTVSKKQENPFQSNSNLLTKQIEQCEEIQSQILYCKQIDISEGTQFIKEGYIKYKLKSYEDSQESYQQALQNSKQNEQHFIYYYIGKCLLKQFQSKSKDMNNEQMVQKDKEIMEYFDQTKRLCPSFKKVYQQICKYKLIKKDKLHSLMGNQEQATLFMVQEKQFDVNDYQLLLKLGNIYKYLNQNEPAIKYYDKCLEANLYNLEALYNKGIIKIKIGDIYFLQGKYKECTKMMEQIIKQNKEYSDAYLLLSDSLLKQDKWQDALDILLQRKKSFKLDQRFFDKIKFIYDQNFHKKD